MEITSQGVLIDAGTGPMWLLHFKKGNQVDMYSRIPEIDRTMPAILDWNKGDLIIAPSGRPNMRLTPVSEEVYQQKRQELLNFIIPKHLARIISTGRVYMQATGQSSVRVETLYAADYLDINNLPRLEGIDWPSLEIQQGGGTLSVSTADGLTFEQSY